MIYKDGIGGDHQMAPVIVAASDSLHTSHADYVCDGVSDQVEIQAAIDELTTRGGTVYLLDGNYSISSPIVPRERLRVIGEGSETTILELANGTNDSIFKDNSSFADNRIFLNIESMNLEGNNANNTSGNGIELQPSGAGHYWDVVFRDVYIEHFAGDAILCNDSHDYIVDHCLPEYNTGRGIVLTSGDHATIMNGVIKANSVGIDVTGTYYTKIYGNLVQQCTGIGITTDTRTMMFGNMLANNCTSGNNESIYMKGYYAIINGNVGYFSGTNGDYNVTIDAGSWGHMVSNNYFVGSQIKEVNDPGGLNTLVRNNLGFLTEKSGTATVANGSTSIVVTHGLSTTPVAGDIMVTPIGTWGAMTEFYIDTYTATTFTIHADQDPTQDVGFAWKAVVL